MNKIALLLSGGVDSSVALHMLCQLGEKPDCFYIHIGPDEKDSYSCTSANRTENSSWTSFFRMSVYHNSCRF